LPLGDHDDVDRKFLAGGKVCLERFHVQEQLPFVVNGSAREDLAVSHGRLERRRRPQLERLGRLHVVVAVDENGGRALRLSPFADDDRMSRGRVDFRRDRKSTRLNSSHVKISYAVFCLKKENESLSQQPLSCAKQ